MRSVRRLLGRALCAIGLHRTVWRTVTPGLLAAARQHDAKLGAQVNAAFMDTLLEQLQQWCTRCERRLW